MGQLLHGSARATAAARRTIQHSQVSLNSLAERYDINAETVAKWKYRSFVTDARMGLKQPRSTALTPEQESTCVAFRTHTHTLLSLDDCLYALQSTIPSLTRSSLHRCFERHGISRLPDVIANKPVKKKFKPYPIGYFHIDIVGCARKPASCICSSPSTARRSLRMPSCTSTPASWKRHSSYGI